MLNGLFSSWLPASCLLCGDDCHEGERMQDLLCQPCLLSLPNYSCDRCPTCALPSAAAQTCGSCLSHPPYFDATQALWRYAFPLDGLVQSLKFSRHLPVARFFAKAMNRLESIRPPDLIVPVPLARERLRERGFNQALEISRSLARRLASPVEVVNIRRHRSTAAQSMLPWNERRGNIRGVFECCNADLSGKAILVIDDVMTTGSTLDELARVLKAHGANWVENLVLARTLKDEP